MKQFRREDLAEGVTLYCGDCRDVLPTLDRADMLLTDPPYKVTSGGFGSLKGGFSGWIKDAYDNKGKIVACDIQWREWLSITPQALRLNAHAYIFSNDRNLIEARIEAERAGLVFHRLLVWDKRAALPNRWYQQTCEFVLFMRKGTAFMINNPSSKALQSIFQRDETNHPTEKPVDLCSLYISNSTSPCEVVLDPFMGSGTTGVAAVRLRRWFTGIEIEPRHFDTACRRISDALSRPDLFITQPKPIEKSESLSLFDAT